jgi:hypothetical protein
LWNFCSIEAIVHFYHDVVEIIRDSAKSIFAIANIQGCGTSQFISWAASAVVGYMPRCSSALKSSSAASNLSSRLDRVLL